MRNSSAIGIASFPRGPHDLRSTQQCPACFTPLQSTSCRVCRLDLMHPLAGELAALSTAIADELDARLALIDRMRREPVTPVVSAHAPTRQRDAELETGASPPIPPPASTRLGAEQPLHACGLRSITGESCKQRTKKPMVRDTADPVSERTEWFHAGDECRRSMSQCAQDPTRTRHAVQIHSDASRSTR